MKTNRERIRERARLLRNVREFFHGEGFFEVDTPALTRSILPEPSIDVFTTCAGNSDGERYLLPSPEKYLKRLIAGGESRIYQLSHAFRRNEPASGAHAHEFTMLEWYAIESDYRNELERTLRLLRNVFPNGSPATSPPLTLSVQEAFVRFAGVRLDECRSAADFMEHLAKLGLPFDKEESWPDLFHRVLVGFIDPALADYPSVVLTDYPSEVGCLARRKPGTQWRERWELYLQGVEIANCYSEETDGRELAAFIASESREMSERDERIDTAFADIHDAGQRPYSGVALGFDRLLMVAGGYDTIDQVILFPGEISP